MARIAVIAMGGTIDSVGSSRLDLAHYTEHRTRLNEGELIASLPELSDLAEVVEVPFRRIPSYALTSTDWGRLAADVERLLHDSVDGVVITHGTNTIEETAFALHLTVNEPFPVVLVGAMRPANALSSDGALNLVRAVQVAATPGLSGVYVVLDDTIHAAPWVTKESVFGANALASPHTGPVGYVEPDGRVILHNVPVPGNPLTFRPEALNEMPRVDVVVSYVGADGTMIDAAVAAGARGIVAAGTGAGRCTPAEDAALDRAVAAGTVVCQGSRVPSGRVSRSPAMRSRGFLTAEGLAPWKARILLGLGLTRSDDIEELQEYFTRF